MLKDEDLAQEIHLHLQVIGKFMKAMDIVNYLDTPEMKMHLKLKKTISLMMAQCWMQVMDYHGIKNPQGHLSMAMSETMLSHIETMCLFW